MPQQNLFEAVKTGAVFSDCRTYRYCLWRVWDTEKKGIVFIGLNPSTANETQNDATIRRVIRFAKDWGYGGIHMMNLFALVSKKPEALKTHPNPIGLNDTFLNEITKGKDILFAWGNFKIAEARAKEIIERYPGALCLKKNANGTPIHPLFVRADTKPIQF